MRQLNLTTEAELSLAAEGDASCQGARRGAAGHLRMEGLNVGGRSPVWGTAAGFEPAPVL